MNKGNDMNNDVHQGIHQLKQIIGGFQDELASLLWDNTPQARDREKVLVRTIVAHTQAIDKLEAMMTEGA